MTYRLLKRGKSRYQAQQVMLREAAAEKSAVLTRRDQVGNGNDSAERTRQVVTVGRNVDGKCSCRGGQKANKKQAVEEQRSCKRLSAHTQTPAALGIQ